MPRRTFVWLAIVVWAFAVAGAVGVADWLKLSSQDAIALIAIVGGVAFFGAFIPVARLGKS